MHSIEKFNIAILTEKIKDTKIISDSLKNFGLLPHFFQSMGELWMELDKEQIDLLVVDVKKMTEGKIQLASHPKIKDGLIKVVYFYQNSTKLLLKSAYKTHYYGQINGDVDLEAQFKLLFQRFNSETHLKDHINFLENKIKNNEKVANQKIDGLATAKKNFEAFLYTEKICSAFGEVGNDSFINKLGSFLDRWQGCEFYSIYQLDKTTQKLQSPRNLSKKFRKLPQLNPPHKQSRGISRQCIDMAIEVSFDTLGKKTRLICIDDVAGQTQIIVLGSFTENKLKSFQWGLLEMKLSLEFIKSQAIKLVEKYENPHELVLDDLIGIFEDIELTNGSFHQVVAKVSFAKLNKFIGQEIDNKFLWTDFRQYLRDKLLDLFGGRIEFCFNGLNSLILLIDKENAQDDINQLNSFFNKTEYWNFFTKDVLLSSNITPRVQIAKANIETLLNDNINDTENNDLYQSSTRPIINFSSLNQ